MHCMFAFKIVFLFVISKTKARANALTEESNNLIAQHKEEKDELAKSLSQFEDNFSKLKNDFEQLQKENEVHLSCSFELYTPHLIF